jgi:HK97 gp10 family phage protein
VLKSDLTRIANSAGNAAKAALLQTGADIVDMTKQLAPVDTGNLRDSYGAVPVSSHEVHVGTDTTYAPYVELGTVHMMARPHLTPAFAQAEPTFRARLKQEMEKLI